MKNDSKGRLSALERARYSASSVTGLLRQNLIDALGYRRLRHQKQSLSFFSPPRQVRRATTDLGLGQRRRAIRAASAAAADGARAPG